MIEFGWTILYGSRSTVCHGGRRSAAPVTIAMTVSVLLLLLLSALLHAGWNLLLKRSPDKVIFTWLAMGVTAGLASPVLLLMAFHFSRAGLYSLLASAVAETAYFIAISKAYTVGDISVVYPLARGSAPVYIAFWSRWLLGERLPAQGWLGLWLIVLGIYTINVRRAGDLVRPLRMLREPAAQWALTAGLFISLYSLADKLGVALIPPPVFITLCFALTALLLTPYVIALRGRAVIFKVVGRNGGAMVAGGLMVMAAYLMVLYAMTMADLTRVGAAREVSIIFGALIGWLALKEGFGLVRTGSAALIFLGIFWLSRH